jgi:hypothetical protein
MHLIQMAEPPWAITSVHRPALLQHKSHQCQNLGHVPRQKSTSKCFHGVLIAYVCSSLLSAAWYSCMLLNSCHVVSLE